jgi:uncharacterized membrane protein YtjA (UPF0391 family)
MDWYYADGREKRGPFPEAQIQSLIQSGAITPATLVWNSSFTDWKAAGETALFSSAPPPGAGRTERCIVTGKTFPVSQMIQTENGWVSAEGKEAYYQSRREGAPIPTAAGVSNARCDGKRIVIPVEGGRLPLRCVKTNGPVTEAELKTKKLYWATPWIAVTILLSLLVYIVLYLIMRKKVLVDIPISAAGRGMVRKHAAIAWVLGLGGIAVGAVGLAHIDRNGWMLVVGGLVMFLVGLVYGGYRGVALRVTKINNGEAWLAGACPEFLALLPPY